MKTDEEIDKKVLDLIVILEKRGLVGINRVIKNYLINFKFSKSSQVTDDKSKPAIVQTGDALSSMGESITNVFAGGRI